MLHKRLARFTFILLLISLIAGSAIAGSKFIRAERGGVVPLGHGALLLVPPDALSNDAVIMADYIGGDDALVFEFAIDSGDTSFSEPLILSVPYSIYKDAADLALQSMDGSDVIEPSSEGPGNCLQYRLDHFSAYYFDRR